MRHWSFGRAVVTILVVGMSGCGGQEEAGPVERPPLPPAEVFSWGGQPISFSPPPEGWRREKEQSGGLRGARFVLAGSVGERIHVAEHYQLDDRDHAGCPKGWLHFDHGREQHFERGLLQMSIADLGPVDGAGYEGAIEEARDLWRTGRLEDAREALGRLRLRAAFSSEEEWRAFGLNGRSSPRRSTLPPRGSSTRRTARFWSHDHRQRFLFVVNEGHLLVARTELGAFSEVEGALEVLAESLEFRPEGYQ